MVRHVGPHTVALAPPVRARVKRHRRGRQRPRRAQCLVFTGGAATALRTVRSGGWRPTMQLTRPVVLVVEDDPSIGELLCELLEGAGYDVAIATDGAAGLALIEAGSIDLVLLDWLLP